MSGLQIIRKVACLLPLMLAPTLMAAEASPANLLAAGRVDDALLTLQSRIKAAPNDAESQNLLCRAYLALTNWEASIAACQKAVAAEPGSSQYHLWLGRAYGEKAERSTFLSAIVLAKKVRSEFETSVRLDPSNVEAHADLADYYVQAPWFLGGGTDKAVTQAQQLMSLDPAEAHLVRAQIAEKGNDQAAAEREFRAAIQASGD